MCEERTVEKDQSHVSIQWSMAILCSTCATTLCLSIVAPVVPGGSHMSKYGHRMFTVLCTVFSCCGCSGVNRGGGKRGNEECFTQPLL